MRVGAVAPPVRDIVRISSVSGPVVHYSIPVLEATGLPDTQDASDIESDKLRVRAGDVLISKLNPRKSRVVRVSDHGSALILSSTEFVGFRPSPLCDGDFLSYFLQSSEVTAELASQVTSVTRSHQRVDPSVIRSLDLPDISALQQRRVAGFLRRETAEIDAFIADQEELIGLLAERRAATISHAVTKGLDPTVPMKDSGVEWIGNVPAIWGVQKLGWLSRIGNGSTPSRENPDFWADGFIPWLSSTVVNSKSVEHAKEFVTSEARAACHLPMVRRGSVLVGLTGQGRTRGMAARLGFSSTISQHLAYVDPRRALSSDFAFWVLVSAYAQLRRLSDGNGGTKGGLTCTELGSLRIPLPPEEDQSAIASYLDQSTSEIDAAIADAKEAIALSRERRAALISAAVTGKIDVREHGAVA